MTCLEHLASLPHLAAFLDGYDPHGLPPGWGLGDDPDTLTTEGLDRILGLVADASVRKLLPRMTSSGRGYISGVAQIAFAAALHQATGSAVLEEPGPDHPIDVGSMWKNQKVMCEVKYWSVPRNIALDGSWQAPVMSPGIEEAASVVVGSRPGSTARPPGRGRISEFRDHFEGAARQLVANDPDRSAVRVAAVATTLTFPHAYWDDLLQGESTTILSIRPDGDIAAQTVRPYEGPDSTFEPTGLANRQFARDVDVAVWFAFEPWRGVSDHRLAGSPSAKGLMETLRDALGACGRLR